MIKSLLDIFPDSEFLKEMKHGKTGGVEVSVICGANDWLCVPGTDFPFVKSIFIADGGHSAVYSGLNKKAREAVLKILERG